MFGPSPNILINTATIYPLSPIQDADAGIDPTESYPSPVAVNVACSAQNYGPAGEEATENRVSEYNRWLVFFGVDYGLKPDDKIVLGTGEILFVTSVADAGGRGAVWEVEAVQRV